MPTTNSFMMQLLPSVAVPLLGIALLCLLLALLCRLTRTQFRLAALKQLNVDDRGGVQSLSFVMFIVQLSQITIGQIGVEYAAFAAARSAIVWIPARGPIGEGENQIGSQLQFQRFAAYSGDDEVEFDLAAYLEFGIVPAGVTHIYAIYDVVPGGTKYEKVRTAAAMALMNVCPSRDVVESRTTASASATSLYDPAYAAYVALAPTEEANPRITPRLQNKLNYALEHTQLKMEIRHKDSAAFLDEHDIREDRYEFRLNEVDWQDHVIVSVFHEFALLPGPGRLLARRPDARPGEDVDESYADGQSKDRIGARIQRRYTDTYVFPLSATARLTVEGFKPIYTQNQPDAALSPWQNQTSPNITPW